ncbi:MAG TPA: hypothetical protein VG537_03615 [Candidatus Kapabacteria bacterium]|nr:hypothetical protein [Candidatus Kapabacteria bacterium]
MTRHIRKSASPSMRILLLSLLSILMAGTASALWNKIQQFPHGFISSSYFFSVDTGLIGFNGVLGGQGAPIKRTTNGGQTWIDCTTPTIYASEDPYITDIWFLNADTGWATVAGRMDVGTSLLWRTTDAGSTWSAVPGTAWNWPSGVRQTSQTLIVTEGAGVGIHVSIDSGKSWATTFSQFNGGVDFLNDQYGVATNVNSPAKGYLAGFLCTSDGGRQWGGAGVDFKHEAWSVYAMKHSSMFIVAAEDTILRNGTFPGTPIYRSTPNSYGYDWQLITTLPFRGNGCITGISNGLNNVLYIQNSGTYGNYTAGLYRSRDSGFTWASVGGPNENTDVRFSVLRCGDVIYAFDNTGGLWKTTDGGDGAVIPECVCINKDTLRPATATICDTINNRYWLHNPNVGAVSIIDLRIIDTTRRPVTTTAVVLDSLPDPDQTLEPGDSAAFRIGWRPIDLMDSTASDSALVRVILYAGYLERVGLFPYDTIYLPVRLFGLGLPAQYALNARTVRLDSLPTCTSVDTILDLTNQGCDSLAITRAALLSAINGQLSDWTLTDSLGHPLTFPIKIGSGGSARLFIHENPRSPKIAFDSIRVTTHYMGRDSSFGIGLRATVKMQLPLAASSTVAFDSLATCASIDSTITFTNTGCDTVRITQATLAAGDWTLSDTNGSPIKLPIVIPPGQHSAVKLHFAPKTLGATSSSLALRYHYLNFDSTSTLTLTGSGVPSGTLEYASTFDFGTVSMCQQSSFDSIFTFRNTSCDSTLLDSLVLPSPFIFLDSSKLPLWVESGKTITLRVGFRPIGIQQQTVHGQVTFYINDGKQKIDDSVMFTGAGIGGMSALATNPPITQIAFAPRTECDHTDSVLFAIYNSGCDTLRVIGITPDNSLASVLEAHTNTALPNVLVQNDSLHITIALSNLIAGNYAGNIHVHYTLADGSTHDTLIPVTFSISKAPRVMSIDSSARDLGTFHPCLGHDTAIVYTNTGCGPLVVHQRSVSGGGFVLSKNGGDTIILAPGKSDTIYVGYDGTDSGAIGTTVTIVSNADQNATVTIPVTGIALPADSVHFKIALTNMPVHAGENFQVMLYPDRVVQGKNLHSISGILEYYADAFNFDPTSVSTMPGLSLLSSGPVTFGRTAHYTFALTSNSDISLDPAVPILTATLMADVADSVGGNIFVDSLRLNGSDPSFDCILASSALGVQSQFAIFCADSLLIEFLGNQPLLLVERPRPNPVSARDGYQAAITLQAATEGLAEIELSDGIGRTLSRETIQLSAGAPANYSFNLTDLASGTYLYSVRFASAKGGTRVSGSMLLVK